MPADPRLRALLLAAAAFAIFGATATAMFPWEDLWDSGRLFFILALIVPVWWLTGIAILLVAATTLRLLTHLHHALQPDFQTLATHLRRRP